MYTFSIALRLKEHEVFCTLDITRHIAILLSAELIGVGIKVQIALI